MRELRCEFLGALLPILLWILSEPAVSADARPNIVFIMTDDQGPWALGAAGDPNAVTPNLDRLRSEGVMLTRCYTPTPVCSPARASVLTSRYGSELGITDFISRENPAATGLSPDIPTWPGLLSQAGYTTGLVGKYHCGPQPESHPTKIGYDEFTGFIHGGMTSRNPEIEVDGRTHRMEGWTPDLLTHSAIDFIRRHRESPFALSLHFWAPHANQGVNETGDRTWLPLSDADTTAFRDAKLVLPESDFPGLDVPRTTRMLREYLASIHSVDRNIGRLLTVLDKLKLARNTVVIFTSDHGYHLGHHGIWHKGNGRWLLVDNQGARSNMWEHSLRVPAIVRWPKMIPPHTTVNHTVSHLDWFPTILAMAGVELPSDTVIRGRNMEPQLRGRRTKSNDDFFAQYRMRPDHAEGADMRSYQTSDWKIVRYLRSRRADEFYDRRRDPQEQANMAKSQDPVVQQAMAQLHTKLMEAMTAINDTAE